MGLISDPPPIGRREPQPGLGMSAAGSPSRLLSPPHSGGLLLLDGTEVLTVGGQPAGLTQGLVFGACYG